MTFYERQPHIQPLHSLITEVMRGEILVPRFQRPGTGWNADQRRDLLDSIYREFPVGTILLWSTREEIKTMPAIGGFSVPIPPEKSGATKRLLLDGHQRLATLVRILGEGLELDGVERSPEALDEPPEKWVFDLGVESEEDNRGSDRFVLLKEEQDPSDTQLPLSLVLSRPRLNQWIRERDLSDKQVLLADSLRDRMREYMIPVAVLGTNSLEEATESFGRINSSGTPMSRFNMVAALAYTKDLDMQADFSVAREKYLKPIGWGELEDIFLLRVCAGLANEDPSKIDVRKLAKRIQGQTELINETFSAVARAAAILGEIGVQGPGVLPYIWQLITLSIRMRDFEDLSRTDQQRSDAIKRWFWLTTYGGVFAGVKSAVYKRAGEALMSMISGGGYKSMDRDMSPKVGEITRFDFASARAKACALAMARFQDTDREDFPSFEALARGAQSIDTLDPQGKKSDWWNRVVVTPQTGLRECRDALRRRADGDSPESGDDALLSRIGISEDARGDVSEILEARRRKLADEEKRFVEELELIWE